jgi:hypothetical protein
VPAEKGVARGERYRVQKAILSQEEIAVESCGQLKGGENRRKWRKEME